MMIGEGHFHPNSKILDVSGLEMYNTNVQRVFVSASTVGTADFRFPKTLDTAHVTYIPKQRKFCICLPTVRIFLLFQLIMRRQLDTMFMY